jgi:TRAP-type C4-dicarboxylate transport system permease small subunit
LRLQFKKEVGLLLIAISLFMVGTFLYSHQTAATEATILAASINYPYRSLALAFVGIGFASMVIASVSYSRKTKNSAKIELAAQNCSHKQPNHISAKECDN